MSNPALWSIVVLLVIGSIILILYLLIMRNVFKHGIAASVSFLGGLIAAQIAPEFIPKVKGAISYQQAFSFEGEFELLAIDKALSSETLYMFLVADGFLLFICSAGYLVNKYLDS